MTVPSLFNARIVTGSNRDRISFTAGNNVLTTFSEATYAGTPDNTRGTVTIGKTDSTTLLNSSDTVVPTNRTLAVSGSEFVFGTRGLAPYNVPPAAFYNGTMNANSSAGLGIGSTEIITADPVRIPIHQDFSPGSNIRFTGPPRS